MLPLHVEGAAFYRAATGRFQKILQIHTNSPRCRLARAEAERPQMQNPRIADFFDPDFQRNLIDSSNALSFGARHRAIFPRYVEEEFEPRWS